ncbi:hypothetical protein THTE_4231 [Thermogutta terrifontis]|uniref:Coenzyme PQQ synthesis protein D (PqqD) n=1 Tax=Thermogutta terrifontis TaxID=1331910 RepID=A0A286RLK4_9BACT|nr:PqqD family protein [Thermogutta terrifontis]ASV76832.1 hypothetical protein THTE_4231 [Thermogutta terrifontis]
MSLKVKQGVKVRPERFGALVFTNRTPILAFNHDAYEIWKQIDGRRDLEEIADNLACRFGLTKEEVYPKVKEFMDACINLDLLARE